MAAVDLVVVREGVDLEVVKVVVMAEVDLGVEAEGLLDSAVDLVVQEDSAADLVEADSEVVKVDLEEDLEVVGSAVERVVGKEEEDSVEATETDKEEMVVGMVEVVKVVALVEEMVVEEKAVDWEVLVVGKAMEEVEVLHRNMV